MERFLRAHNDNVETGLLCDPLRDGHDDAHGEGEGRVKLMGHIPGHLRGVGQER